jgi:hypothetical protein
MKIGMKALLVSSLLLSLDAAYADGTIKLMLDRSANLPKPATVIGTVVSCSDFKTAITVTPKALEINTDAPPNSAQGTYTANPEDNLFLIATLNTNDPSSNSNSVMLSSLSWKGGADRTLSYPNDFSSSANPCPNTTARPKRR